MCVWLLVTSLKYAPWYQYVVVDPGDSGILVEQVAIEIVLVLPLLDPGQGDLRGLVDVHNLHLLLLLLHVHIIMLLINFEQVVYRFPMVYVQWLLLLACVGCRRNGRLEVVDGGRQGLF